MHYGRIMVPRSWTLYWRSSATEVTLCMTCVTHHIRGSSCTMTSVIQISALDQSFSAVYKCTDGETCNIQRTNTLISQSNNVIETLCSCFFICK
ncbi:hypothetical protein GDO81_026977 [Engystomops pustulosus]|uniref:UPAR/Ly6 domain-containing protein n=1 Tax=Engystomops pustulosus TaxID=76066 RepID=A0AAV6YN09_ENGPU|nr:hypothetical protein GDO81_026977 [Engystomops pustulosus]